MNEQLEKLTSRVAVGIGPGPAREQIAAKGAEIVDQAVKRVTGQPVRRTRGVALVVGAAAAAVVALMVIFQIARQPGLECRVDGQLLAEGSWISVPSRSATRTIHYSDGSLIAAAPASRVRLTALGDDRVRLLLESGRLENEIAPARGITWIYQAGPFRVQVLGTRFTMDWSPGSEMLVVEVWAGLVSVSRDGSSDQPVRVSPGKRLVARADGSQLFLLEQEEASTALGPPLSRTNDPQLSSDAGPEEKKPASTDGTDPNPVVGRQAVQQSDWKRLAEQGKYREAVALAEEQGFGRLVDQLPVWDLVLLADVARMGRSPGLAEQALVRVRQRFPGHRAAQMAAFRLGRLEFDRGALRPAATWFKKFLAEAPHHRLADDARGRCMEALHLLGDRAGARQLAEQYLGSSPDGHYARLARSLVEGSE